MKEQKLIGVGTKVWSSKNVDINSVWKTRLSLINSAPKQPWAFRCEEQIRSISCLHRTLKLPLRHRTPLFILHSNFPRQWSRYSIPPLDKKSTCPHRDTWRTTFLTPPELHPEKKDSLNSLSLKRIFTFIIIHAFFKNIMQSYTILFLNCKITGFF